VSQAARRRCEGEKGVSGRDSLGFLLPRLLWHPRSTRPGIARGAVDGLPQPAWAWRRDVTTNRKTDNPSLSARSAVGRGQDRVEDGTNVKPCEREVQLERRHTVEQVADHVHR